MSSEGATVSGLTSLLSRTRQALLPVIKALQPVERRPCQLRGATVDTEALRREAIQLTNQLLCQHITYPQALLQGAFPTRRRCVRIPTYLKSLCAHTYPSAGVVNGTLILQFKALLQSASRLAKARRALTQGALSESSPGRTSVATAQGTTFD